MCEYRIFEKFKNKCQKMKRLEIKKVITVSSFTFNGVEYNILDSGVMILPDGSLFFPDTSITNLKTKKNVFITNIYKSGVKDFKFYNDEIHLYGDNMGQGFHWDIYGMDGTFLDSY